MNIAEAIKLGVSQLKNFNNAVLETEILLSEVVEKDRVFLKTHNTELLTNSQISRFEAFISKRENHVPITYILGYKDWNGLKVKVNQSTLIPRDETEILCHHIKKDLQSSKSCPELSILDIGTGSGCIAVWMKQQFSSARVTATDISKEALLIARENSLRHKVDINLVRSDLFENIKTGSVFDCVIANLPYVPTGIKVSKEVQKEPKTAIFSGVDGLDHVRGLANKLEEKNIHFKSLWLEFLPQQKNEIQEIFKKHTVIFFGDESGEIFFAKIL